MEEVKEGGPTLTSHNARVRFDVRCQIGWSCMRTMVSKLLKSAFSTVS